MRLRNFLIEKTDSNTLEWDITNVYNELMKNCSTYINSKDFNSKYPLYRGMAGIGSRMAKDGFAKLKIRENREPRGTSSTYFPIINDWLTKNKFCGRKNAVFCTGNYDHANQFDKAYILFPSGSYKYTYIKGKDFNVIEDDSKWHPTTLMWALRKDFADKNINVVNIMKEDGDINKNFLKSNLVIGWNNATKFLEKNPDTIISVSNLEGGFWRTKKTYREWAQLEKNLKNTISNTNIQQAAKNKWEIWFECENYYLIDLSIFKELVNNYGLK